ncbi:hypothetical protein EAT51_04790 [Pseudoxanthomonas winnipegensis]|nr:hypothetical protein EAT51_04790 [Pseudoxanthomonas winnipegensis]
MRNVGAFDRLGIGDWGLGIGDWGLGIGDWARCFRTARRPRWWCGRAGGVRCRACRRPGA